PQLYRHLRGSSPRDLATASGLGRVRHAGQPGDGRQCYERAAGNRRSGHLEGRDGWWPLDDRALPARPGRERHLVPRDPQRQLLPSVRRHSNIRRHYLRNLHLPGNRDEVQLSVGSLGYIAASWRATTGSSARTPGRTALTWLAEFEIERSAKQGRVDGGRGGCRSRELQFPAAFA